MTEAIVQTNKVKAVLGVYEGYHNEDKPINLLGLIRSISSMYQKIAEKNFQEYKKQTGREVYVSAVININATVYREEWGCPKNGEPTFTIECTRNPYFIPDAEEYKTQAVKNILELKELLKQSTVMIEYSTVECSYIQ